MQIVINIPEKLACEGFERPFTEEEKNILIKAIGNGAPLRKGHDKLIDVKDLLEYLCLEDTKENRKLNMGEHITIEDIDRIKPVIEADKE